MKPSSAPPHTQLAQAECEAEQLQWQAAQAKRENRQLARSGRSGTAADVALTALNDGAAPMGMPGPPAAVPARQEEAAAGVGPVPAQQQASLASSAAASAVGGNAAAAADSAQGGTLHSKSADNPLSCSESEEQPGVRDACGWHAPIQQGGAPGAAEEVAELAAAAVADPLAGMYGAPPPHEEFDLLLLRFRTQVGRERGVGGAPLGCRSGGPPGAACQAWPGLPGVVVPRRFMCNPQAATPTGRDPRPCRQVDRVKAFLEEHGLRLRDPSATVLPPALRGQVLVLVQESLGICRDLLRVGKHAELPALPSWCAARGERC